MEEAFVTLSIIDYLEKYGWEIISYDYPQSGTGIMLKLSESEKNKGGIIPDIIAYKNNTLIVMENKNRYSYNDFIKINEMKISRAYEQILSGLSSKYIRNFYYGIGLPDKSCKRGCEQNKDKIDFLFKVNEDGKIIFESYITFV